MAVDVITKSNKTNMNKTEAEYALVLEAMKRRGEILRYDYEGITLRWPVGDEIIKYTPDFLVFRKATAFTDDERILLVEIKGSFRKMPGIYERAVERFRHAQTYWPEFSFEMLQKKLGEWVRIH